MHNLEPITPLGGTTPRQDRIGGVTITENPDRALASLAARLGRVDDCTTAMRGLLGGDLPDVAQAGSGEVAAFWTGPEQWMLEAPHDTHEDLAARVGEAVGDAGSVTEQTDGWCRFEVTGSDAVALFERLCPLDLRKLEAGRVSRTTIEHLGCFVICRDTARAYSVMGPRSSAATLHHALVSAAHSIA
ncbi:sarcosine oxidase subunit gamma [Brevirhabdus sp.]|uniref:sarcosine oxidase subunit gamma n=1 Tax=Brevirhabdus sp. TaxID=2004514 RepID=UPI0040598F6A